MDAGLNGRLRHMKRGWLSELDMLAQMSDIADVKRARRNANRAKRFPEETYDTCTTNPSSVPTIQQGASLHVTGPQIADGYLDNFFDNPTQVLPLPSSWLWLMKHKTTTLILQPVVTLP